MIPVPLRPTVFPLTVAQQWAIDHKVLFGSSTGTTFVVEGWLSGGTIEHVFGFKNTQYQSQADWEKHLRTTLGDDVAVRTLQNHWCNFISEECLIDAAYIGCRLMRVPIGMWAFDGPVEKPSDPYQVGGQQTEHFTTGSLLYIELLIERLCKRNMQVVIDLHAAHVAATPCQAYAGSMGQPPFWFWSKDPTREISAGCPGTIDGTYESSSRPQGMTWQEVGIQAMVRAAQWVRTMNAKLGQTCIVALELLNEPALGASTVSQSDVWDLFGQAVPLVQAELADDVATMLSFIGQSYPGSGAFVKGKILDGSWKKNIICDDHRYFNYSGTKQSASYWLNQTCTNHCCDDYVHEYLSNGIQTYVGEWSTACSGDDGSLTFGGLSDGMTGEEFLKHMYANQMSNFYRLSRTGSFWGSSYWTLRGASGWNPVPTPSFPHGTQSVGTSYKNSDMGFPYRSWNLCELVAHGLVVPVYEMGLTESVQCRCQPCHI